MRKQVLQFYLLLLLSLVGFKSAQAQSLSLTLSSPTICLGDQLNLDAALTGLPAGVTATSCTFDFNNDGTVETTIPNGGPNYSTQYLYPASGTYTIKAEVNLSNGSKTPATASVIVYRLPIPGAIVNGQAVQCFRGNLVTLTNTQVKTDNRIYRTEIIWGDGNIDVTPFPNPGQNYSHSYNSNGQFNITVKVVDSVGCFKDTTYSGMLTIKANITPSFNVLGAAGCKCTPFMFQNTTTLVPFGAVNSYTWDFGDGKKITRSRPWKLPKDSLNYDTIWHTYCKNGTFLPALTIEDTTGCIDSLRYTTAMTVNKPRNIIVELNPIPYLNLPDEIKGYRRDSVCYDKEGTSTLTFIQKPNPEINPGNGELMWNFGDPPSQQANININSWNPSHTFVRGLGAYNVNLMVWPLQPNPACRKDTTIVVEVLGPRARIEKTDPPPVLLNPLQQNQCNPNASGYYNVIEFVNTSQYYKSEHVFRRWDFGDDVAPQCTSFLIPKAGYPPAGGWATAQDQYNFSDGFWRQGGKVFEGRRLDCRFSADTLPIHRYPSWDKIYNWYLKGHDFMPWNTNQYTRTPADTLPTANPRKIWVTDEDTLWWNKPVYLNPVTGVWSLTQGNGPAPYGLWPRIDTVESVDENGQPNPQDLRPYNRFTLQNGAPDPIAGFWGNTKRGGYGFFPKGFVVDPQNDTMTAKYTAINGDFFRHHYDSMVDPSRTLYRFLFDKAVQKCHSVTLFLRDSLNNVGEKAFLVRENLGGSIQSDYGFVSYYTTYIESVGGTILSIDSLDDDVSYAPKPIGFPFNYNGVTYSEVGVHTNGYLTLGGMAGSEGQKVLSTLPRTIAAFAGDLQGKGLPDSKISMQVFGFAPNRTCVIQWKNFGRFPYDLYKEDTFNFQILLNENGYIDVVYGNNFAFDTIKEKSYTVGVGINGDDPNDFAARAGSFVSSLSATTNTDRILMNDTILPSSGLTYRWGLPQMGFDFTNALQITDSVDRGSKERLILNVRVMTNGGSNPLSVTEFVFNANGSTNKADISKAKLYYTGRSRLLHLSNNVFDSTLNVSGNFTLSGNKLLNAGENNFWLVYDITDSAAIDNIVDAEFVSVKVDGTSRTPFVSAPAGGRRIYKSDLQVFNKDVDRMDCEDEDQVQLKLMRPDATGLGVQGKECPGSYVQNNQAGLRFMLNAVDNTLGQYPGISPDCGASWIRINLDSMADRRDQTPCQLDGFINYTGATGPSPQTGGVVSQTPGGLIYPPFSTLPDYNQYFMPANRWNSPSGTFFWYHYGSNVFPLQQTQSGITLFPPANPTGDITVGLIIGTGDPNNPCISDTVWYHNYLNITDMDGRFYVDPTYHPVTNVPSNGQCKYYCANSTVNFVYLDSVQSYIHSSTIDWGDNTVTVDSFYYSPKPGLTNGYFVNGFRRERYVIDFGTCGQNTVGTVLSVTPFPNGLPGTNVTYRYIDNYTMRIFDATNNPNGSLLYIGKVSTNDSTIWEECGKRFVVADVDTLKYFYRTEELDPAKMLLPVQHTYWRSSFTAACKAPGSTPRPVQHKLVSTKDCVAEYVDNKLLVRGVIDSVMSRDAKGNFDSVFCKNEPVHFYDSIRYYRGDCSLSHPIFNPNGTPIIDPQTCNVSIGAAYDPPFNEYNYDTVDYWRTGSTNINNFHPCGSYVEKVKYYFGDGDSASWTNPIHVYKQAGAYTVTMLSRDKNGCWDTSYCTVYITEPNAIPVIKPGIYNCGNPVTIFDRSNMTPIPGYSYNPFDSLRFEPSAGSAGIVNRNYWHFGENKVPPIPVDARYIDTPVWNYRGNGFFQIMLVVESAQGCLDTGYANLNIIGPRPAFQIISDSVGCAPFTVKLVNLADVFGATGPNDKPTKRTDILWGDANQQSSVSLNQYDTLSFTYNDSGTFYIFARSDDNNPQSDNIGCKIVYYPDTVGGANAPKKIQVKRSYPAEIEIDKQVVCVDQPFTVVNKSDTISYIEFKYEMYNEDGQVLIDSIIKNNLDNKFTYTFADTGNYSVRLFPNKFAPGLPQCRLYDTLPVKVVRPFASFTIDSNSKPVFGLKNTSVSSSEYTWTASKNGNIIAQVDKVESDRNWSFDFGTDTGDVTICLQAFTPDPAKPVCMDSVCKTISYRFVVEFKIYNVFTPGTSLGQNDFFDIDIKGETSYDLVIYNRWGTKVFESKSSGYDWNGTNMNDGSDCPEGTYFYVFKYELLNGKKETVNGTVTLIREK